MCVFAHAHLSFSCLLCVHMHLFVCVCVCVGRARELAKCVSTMCVMGRDGGGAEGGSEQKQRV